MPGRKQREGAKGEQQAERYLEQQGLIPVTRNYRCKAGELDLIMQHAGMLVFVEVRLRTHRAFGGALASIDPRKQRRLTHAARHYLQRTGWSGPCRFDVIGLDGRASPQWIRNAFDAAD